MATRKTVIPAPVNSDETPFQLGDELTVFEAAMVYSGRHPHSRLLQDATVKDHLDFLKAGIPRSPRSKVRIRARLSRDILREIIAGIERNEIRPSRRAFDESDQVDPIRTRIKTLDLVKLAADRREVPKYLRHLCGGSINKALKKRQRGPVRGTTGFRAQDRKIFPAIAELIKSGKARSAHSAALTLADEIPGRGSPQNKAKRVSALYRKQRRRPDR